MVIRMRIWWIAMAVCVSGCAALPRGSVIFSHTPLLPAGTIQAKAALQIFTDARPQVECEAMKTIPNLNEQVTALLLQDLQQVKLFDSTVPASAQPQADLLLRGEIRSLMWRSRWYPITFIPYLNLVTLLGFPAGRSEGTVNLHLEVVDAHSGSMLAQYDFSSGSSRTYSIYQANDYRGAGGEETREALRTVFDQLKTSLWKDRERFMPAQTPAATTTP